jgi:glycosyltransferase involved in cell wall biosynthesis
VSASPRLVHVTTIDLSLSILLGPQLRAFGEAGYEVIGISAPGTHVAEVEAWGVTHVAAEHLTRSMAPHRDVLALAELTRLFRRLRPDIVHTHNPKPGVYGRLAARAAGVPVIVNTVHGLYALPQDPWPKRSLVYGLERLAATCSHAELVQNPEDIPTLRRLRVPPDRLHLLGNGIDLARFDPSIVDDTERQAARVELGAAPGDVVVGLVGRLVLEKGYAEVFEAARLVRARRPEVHFAVIGPVDPDKADAIPGAAIEAAEADGVRFLGLRRDIERLYAGMDLYVLASHREGFPRSAMEAAAMGLPVIATDIRGCRQVVDHGTTGLLVPVHDAVALARGIELLVEDPARRRAMAAAARRKAAAEFDQKHQIELTLATYDRLLHARRARRAR